MKTIKILIAALAVAISVLGAVNVQGSTTPPFTLDSIPTATSEAGLMDKMVSVPIYAGVTLIYTDTNGVRHGVSPISTPKVFSSYQSYRDFCASNILYGICLVRTNASHPADPKAPAEVSLTLYIPNAATGSSAIDSDTSSLDSITVDWLSSLVPDYSLIVIYVPGLQQFTAIVNDGNPSYVGGWTNNVSPSIQGTAVVVAPKGTEIANGWFLTDEVPTSLERKVHANSTVGHPPEYTRKDCLVLNFWYLLQQYPARFTVVIGSQTNTYTQFGNQIAPPLIQLDGKCLRVSWSQGANTTIAVTAMIAVRRSRSRHALAPK